MMYRARLFAVVAGIGFVGCGGGPTSTPQTLAQHNPVTDARRAPIPYGAPLMAGATPLGRAHVRAIGLDVFMTMRDETGLREYARAANDPKSALFRHWLTPAQIADRFAASASDYAAATQYFIRNGISVKGYPQRLMLRITGPQANVERALGTAFGTFRKSGQVFLAPLSAPTIASSLHVAGLGNAVQFAAKHRQFALVRASTSLITGYSPPQIASAFDYAGAYAAGYRGSGINVGIIGTGPITDGDRRLRGTGDAADYESHFRITGSGSITQVFSTDQNVSPGTGTPPNSYSTGLASPPPVTSGTTSGCVKQGYRPNDPTTASNITDYTTCNPEDGEAQIDTEQAISLAPDANLLFYIAYNPSECGGPCGSSGAAKPSQQIGLPLSDDEIQQAIGDNMADVLSLSFGQSESSATGYYYDSTGQGFGPNEYAALASEGIAVFVSSGDFGAQGCAQDKGADPNSRCIDYPASDPNVVAVGGVNAPLDAAGHLTGPLTTWGEQTQVYGDSNASGGGGGCSTIFSAQTFESPIANPCQSMRAIPDIAGLADTNTAIAVELNGTAALGGPQYTAYGGTSVAAPQLAAMWALVLQACKSSSTCGTGPSAHPYRLGNPNTTMYPLYGTPAYASTFYDVLYGNNSLPNSSGNGQATGFTAGPGYDLTTGLGVPFARNLIKAIANK